jgi:monovalent cation:proton antiporter-2 (CPA2) family protein
MTLSNVALLLAAAIIAVILTRRAKLSAVLGYLAAGIALGPFGLALIRDPTEVLHLAEFGVVLLLFVIGLELKPQRLWVMRRPVFLLGSLQVVASSVVLAVAIRALGIDWVAAAVAGFGMSLSSTALVMQVLAERDELNTVHGRASFSVLLFQDLAAMPALAALPLLAAAEGARAAAAGGGSIDSALAAFKVIALLIGAVAAGRYVLRPVLRTVARTKVREAFTATALLIVLGMSALAAAVGLSMALGAFIAGVLLADSEFRHELEADLDPFRGLLLGLFFVGVGMTANVGLIGSQPLAMLGAAVAMCSIKWAVAAVVARVTGLAGRDARRTGWALAQGGEFAFVLFLAAASQGILSEQLRDQLILIVTLSMLLAPLLILFGEWLEARFGARAIDRPYDAIDANQPRVIIAGFGRFGQIVGRILTTQRIPFTALEISTAQVDFVRRFGNKIYYGDAARLDLLRAAGAEQAQAIVLAIDDVEASVRAAELIHKHYPQLPVLARVRNRQHAYKMMDLGVQYLVRDTLHSSIELSKRLLTSLGQSAEQAQRRVDVFRDFDQKKLEEQHAIYSDERALLQNARQTARELEQLFDQDARPDS